MSDAGRHLQPVADDDEAEVVAQAPASAVVRDALNAHIPESGDFDPEQVVEKALRFLEETEPKALEEWRVEATRHWLRQMLRKVLQDRRRKVWRNTRGQTHKAEDFHDAAKEFTESGEASQLLTFTVVHVVDGKGTRRRVADMDGADHRFVADAYQRRGSRELMLAAFHRQVARALGKQKTADVLNEAQYRALCQRVFEGGGEA